MIHDKVDAIFERMASRVLWQDRRDRGEDRELHGYLTRGTGEAAFWEFRFRRRVEGMREGAVLIQGDGGRWVVLDIVEESLGGETLFFAARVGSLDEKSAPDGNLEALVQSLRGLLEVSAMPVLEREDVMEALQRFASLGADPTAKGHGVRLKQRLNVLRACFQACPQTGQAARGLILRLEAALKRKGLP